MLGNPARDYSNLPVIYQKIEITPGKTETLHGADISSIQGRGTSRDPEKS